MLEDDEQQLRRQHEPRAALEHGLVLARHCQRRDRTNGMLNLLLKQMMRVRRPLKRNIQQLYCLDLTVHLDCGWASWVSKASSHRIVTRSNESTLVVGTSTSG